MSGIVQNHRRIPDGFLTYKMYRKCVPGHQLLSYMVDNNIAPDRTEAIVMCSTLFSYDLLRHITYEHDTSDLDSSALFCLVKTEVPRYTLPTNNTTIGNTEGKTINTSGSGTLKKRRLSSRELMQQQAVQHTNPTQTKDVELAAVKRTSL